MYEPGWPPKCKHPRAEVPDLPDRPFHIVHYLCMGNEELCIFKERDKK